MFAVIRAQFIEYSECDYKYPPQIHYTIHHNTDESFAFENAQAIFVSVRVCVCALFGIAFVVGSALLVRFIMLLYPSRSTKSGGIY